MPRKCVKRSVGLIFQLDPNKMWHKEREKYMIRLQNFDVRKKIITMPQKVPAKVVNYICSLHAF